MHEVLLIGAEHVELNIAAGRATGIAFELDSNRPIYRAGLPAPLIDNLLEWNATLFGRHQLDENLADMIRLLRPAVFEAEGSSDHGVNRHSEGPVKAIRIIGFGRLPTGIYRPGRLFRGGDRGAAGKFEFGLDPVGVGFWEKNGFHGAAHDHRSSQGNHDQTAGECGVAPAQQDLQQRAVDSLDHEAQAKTGEPA